MLLTKISAAFATVLSVSSLTQAAAVPVEKRESDDGVQINDMDILNFALTLEHLEVAYYTQGLNKFNATDFKDAGLPDFARGRFEEILMNEQTHVDTLSEALGANATNPCLYEFPFTDAKAFAKLSAILETVGASAYTGAAALLSDPTFITEAASILATEARQAAWVKSAVIKQNPWSLPFETPLDLMQAFSLASSFIQVCPYSNPDIPISTFPALTVSTPMNETRPGHNITVQFWPPMSYFDSSSSNTTSSNMTSSSNSTDSGSDSSSSNSTMPSMEPQYFLALLSGLDKHFVPLSPANTSQSAYLTYEWTGMLPEDLKGTVFAIVTTDDMMAMDSNTIAGVAILDFPFNSNGTLIMESYGDM